MKTCFSLKTVITGILFLLLKTSFSQPVSPVFYSNLRLPLHHLHYLNEAGLMLLASDMEVQLWNVQTQVYYGGIIISSPENAYIRIRHFEYLKEQQQLAVIGEQISFDVNKTPIYKDYLFVYDMGTLNLVMDPVENGMAELIKYKYSNHTLPELKNASSIYKYCFHHNNGSLYTIDRKGDLNIYNGGAFIKTISTHVVNSQILCVDPVGTSAILTDDSTLVFKRVYLKNETEHTIFKLVSIPSCRNNEDYNEDHKNFSVWVAPDEMNFWVLDSMNRMRFYNSALKVSKENFVPMKNNQRLISMDFNIQTFMGYFIFESESLDCYRGTGSVNLNSKLINTFTFNEIGTARFGYTFHEENGTKLRIMIPAYGEHETDLSKLEELPVREAGRMKNDFYESAAWEHGYMKIYDDGEGGFNIDVFKSDATRCGLLYSQHIKINKGELVCGIRPGTKWYITRSISHKAIDLNTLSFYNSSGRRICSLKVASPLQMLKVPYLGQQIFSNDEQHLMIKEFLGNQNNIDSCRVRVYKTNGFKLEADIRFTEIAGERQFKRNAFFGRDNKTFHFTALSKKGELTRTVLHTYTLTNFKAVKNREVPLCVDSACRLPVGIQAIDISPEHSNITFSGLVNTSIRPEQPVFTQIVRSINANNNSIEWYKDMGTSVMIRKIMYFRGFVGLQTDDNIYFYKIVDGYPEYFMTLQVITNLRYREFSNFYASKTSTDSIPVYYDKSGNDLLVNFNVGGFRFGRAYFDLDFNRPDEIINRIPGGDSAVRKKFLDIMEKRSKRPGNELKEFNISDIPEVKLIRTDYVNDIFKVKVILKGKRPVRYLRVFVNGQEERKEITQVQRLTNAQNPIDSIAYEFLLPLHMGENKIAISAVDILKKESRPLNLAHFEMRAPLRINLHVLILSVGEYKDKTQNRAWIKRDGEAMAKLFLHDLKDTVYGTIEVDTFFNKSVNETNINKWFNGLRNVSPRDYVIVFYNGHGKLDTLQGLVLMTSDAQFQKPFTNAIESQAILDKLDSLPARQKLFLIDACHSGDYFKEELVVTPGVKGNFDFLQKMFTFSQKGKGTFVYTSCAGNKDAVGPDEVKNPACGPFVTAIVEALKENKSAKGAMGNIMINDFFNYVTRRTRELSENLEIPNLKINNPSANWRIK